MWTGQRRPPRAFLVASIGALSVFALVAGWLGWQLSESDRERSSARVEHRLLNAAELAVASLQQTLNATLRRLDAVAAAPDPAAAATSLPGGDAATVVVISPAGLWSREPLLYYPEEPAGAADLPAAFAEAERHEWHGDLTAALTAYRRLASSPDRAIRAGALARAARVARKRGAARLALELYGALASLQGTVALGRPADLLAAAERCAILSEGGGGSSLDVEAAAFESRLYRGEWRLTRGRFLFYRDRVREWRAGAPQRGDRSARASRELLADGVQRAWSMARLEGGAAEGAQAFGAGERRGIIVWRRSGDRTAALVATAGYVERTWLEGLATIEERQQARISVSSQDGSTWSGSRVSRAAVVEPGVETGLPFTLGVSSKDPEADRAAADRSRRRFVGMLGALALIVLTGGYVAARAIGRELSTARLQSDFVAAVSHEFRTPVASVRQLSELLAEGRVGTEARRTEYYELLRRESVRLQDLVENLLDFGRMESAAAEYRLDTLDIEPFLRNVADQFAHSMHVADQTRRTDVPTATGVVTLGGVDRRIELVIGAPLPRIRADRDALGRALWNLLDNAAKYSPPDTSITIEAVAVADAVALRVRNEGTGIPAEEQQLIFQKFVRGTNARASEAKGTGIGLAMVQHIVRAHRGTIAVDSRPGAGAVFTIHLPAEGAL